MLGYFRAVFGPFLCLHSLYVTYSHVAFSMLVMHTFLSLALASLWTWDSFIQILFCSYLHLYVSLAISNFCSHIILVIFISPSVPTCCSYRLVNNYFFPVVAQTLVVILDSISHVQFISKFHRLYLQKLPKIQPHLIIALPPPSSNTITPSGLLIASSLVSLLPFSPVRSLSSIQQPV